MIKGLAGPVRARQIRRRRGFGVDQVRGCDDPVGVIREIASKSARRESAGLTGFLRVECGLSAAQSARVPISGMASKIVEMLEDGIQRLDREHVVSRSRLRGLRRFR